jgi:hypothetical protein
LTVPSSVIPAEAGIQKLLTLPDSRSLLKTCRDKLRGNDNLAVTNFSLNINILKENSVLMSLRATIEYLLHFAYSDRMVLIRNLRKGGTEE